MLEGINPSQTLVDRIGNKLKEIRDGVEGRVIAGLMSPKLLQRAYAQVAIAIGKLEYIEGRIVTGSGIELFVGVKEFPESIRALEEERKRILKGDGE
jgi:hypothetical protein